jgi:DNA-binding XRE family transcriptional regulator
MPVSNPLEIAVLVRETRHRLGLTQLQFAQIILMS